MTPATAGASSAITIDSKVGYNRFLLLVAGLGGLLYGVDVGIIASALPYLEATSRLTAGQLSIVVAAVLLGSVISTLFAGLLADWMGRKPLMILSGILFVVSIPLIAASQGYGSLVFGRLLQGVSGGLIGVVVPLYLAECLSASTRGKGTGVFQWLLTLGIVCAALVGIYFSRRVTRSLSSAIPHAFSPLKTTPGAAFSGSRSHPEFSSYLEAFSSLSLRAGFSAKAKEKRLSPRYSVPAQTIKLIPNCAKWKKAPPPKKPNLPLAPTSRNPCLNANTSSPSCLPA